MRRIYIRFSTFTAFLLVLTFIYSFSANYSSAEYKRFSQNIYRNSLAALTGNIDSITETLEKTSFARPAAELAVISEKLCGLAEQASANANLLPFSEENAANINSFLNGLNKTGGYIVSRTLNGGGAYDSKLANLSMYKRYARLLSHELRVMAESDDYNYPVSEFYSFYDYSGLSSSPSAENGFAIDRKQAEHTARELLGASLKLSFSSDTAAEPAYYRFMCGNAYADIIADNGKLIRLGIDRRINDIKLTEEQALEYITGFLNSHGYTNLVYGSHSVSGGMLIAEFYGVQKSKFGDIVCQNDAVIIGVSLDYGKVCLMNAGSYWKYNCIRGLPDNIVMPDNASEYSLVFMNDGYGAEILCCKIKAGDGCVYYTNAVTGKEFFIY